MRFLIPFLIGFFTVNGQHVIVISGKYSINYQKHQGYIILKSGQTVSGIFEYAEMEFPTYNLKFYNSDGKLVKRYKLKEINKVVLQGSDTTLSKNDSTYFVRLDSAGFLYRQLTFGRVKIFDKYFNVNERIGVIKTPESMIEVDGKRFQCNSEEKFLHVAKDSLPFLDTHNCKSAVDVVRLINERD